MPTTKRFGVGCRRRDGKKLVRYEVYEAPDGCGETYLGRATSVREARRMAARGGGLERSLWDTARAAGHCGGYTAPYLDDGEERAESPSQWFGRGGWFCVVPIWR